MNLLICRECAVKNGLLELYRNAVLCTTGDGTGCCLCGKITHLNEVNVPQEIIDKNSNSSPSGPPTKHGSKPCCSPYCPKEDPKEDLNECDPVECYYYVPSA